MLIVDAHLDLSYNAVRGRDVTAPAAQQLPDAEGIPSVGLPDLRAGGVGLICATIFCEPDNGTNGGYRDAESARAMALRQLGWYRQQISAGQMRFITDREQLTDLRGAAVNAILLIEGADPLRGPEDVPEWFAAGVRAVGLAWRQTRYAGGTGAPGPLSAQGVRLLESLDQIGMVHDVSHLAEDSFWQLLDHSAGAVMASHSNCRAIVPTDRQLSDQMIRALIARDGVIGINFFDKVLLPPEQQASRRATLEDVIRHVRHICALAGDAWHVGLGTDMDGGLGREQIPVEIRSSADLPRVGDALGSAGFGTAEIEGIMGGNWMRFWRRSLPQAKP